jgi:hypothetical protein
MAILISLAANRSYIIPTCCSLVDVSSSSSIKFSEFLKVFAAFPTHQLGNKNHIKIFFKPHTTAAQVQQLQPLLGLIVTR